MRSTVTAAVFAFALLLAVASIATSAGAAGAPPQIKPGTPYPQVRKELIARGIDPQPVAVKEVEWACRYEVVLCRRYPEFMICAPAGVHACKFLFRRRSDGQLWVIGAAGEVDEAQDLHLLRYRGAWVARDADIEDIIIAKPPHPHPRPSL
jgi:hypothetical protein